MGKCRIQIESLSKIFGTVLITHNLETHSRERAVFDKADHKTLKSTTIFNK